MPITLNSALDDYYADRMGHLAQRTRESQQAFLSSWRTWVTKETQPNVYLEDIDGKLMARYFLTLRPPRLAESTYNTYRDYLARFWEYCRAEGHVRVDPMRYIDRLRVHKKARLQLSPDEAQRMLDLTTDPRDRMALVTGLNTGLRASDIVKITIGDINLGDNTLMVNIKKTGEADYMPITTEMRMEVLSYFDWYASQMKVMVDQLANHWRLIPPKRGKRNPTGQHGFSNYLLANSPKPLRHPEIILHQALDRIGLDGKGEGFHTIRRTSGKLVHQLASAEGSADPLRVAQVFYGHKSRAVTEGYLGITVEKKERDALLQGRSLLGRAQELQQAKNDAADGVAEAAAGYAPMKRVRSA